MIQSNKGNCKIDGKGADLIVELNHIFDMLLEKQPELLTGVVTAWSPVMEEMINDMDEALLKGIYKISSELVNDFRMGEQE